MVKLSKSRKKELFLSVVAIFSIILPALAVGYAYGDTSDLFEFNLGDAPNGVLPTSRNQSLLPGSGLDNSTYAAMVTETGAVIYTGGVMNWSAGTFEDIIVTNVSFWADIPTDGTLTLSGSRITNGVREYNGLLFIATALAGSTFENYTLTTSEKVWLQNGDAGTVTWIEVAWVPTVDPGDGFVYSLDYTVKYDIDETQSLIAGIIMVTIGGYFIVLGLFMFPFIDVQTVKRGAKSLKR